MSDRRYNNGLRLPPATVKRSHSQDVQYSLLRLATDQNGLSPAHSPPSQAYDITSILPGLKKYRQMSQNNVQNRSVSESMQRKRSVDDSDMPAFADPRNGSAGNGERHRDQPAQPMQLNDAEQRARHSSNSAAPKHPNNSSYTDVANSSRQLMYANDSPQEDARHLRNTSNFSLDDMYNDGHNMSSNDSSYTQTPNGNSRTTEDQLCESVGSNVHAPYSKPQKNGSTEQQPYKHLSVTVDDQTTSPTALPVVSYQNDNLDQLHSMSDHMPRVSSLRDLVLDVTKAERERQSSYNKNRSAPSTVTHTVVEVHPSLESQNDDDCSSIGSNSSEDNERPLASWEIICLCIPAAAVQVGWCIGEALLIPYLLSLGISATFANLIFLCNPVVGVVLQPALGRWSDNSEFKYGKRTPYLLFLHLFAAVGMLGVVFAGPLTSMLGIEAIDASGNASTIMLVILFLSFGLMDMCLDITLLPSRSLLNDVLPSEQVDYGNACFSLMTSAGACLGLTFILIPLEQLWPLSLIFSQPIRATFAVSFVLLNLSLFISTFMALKLNREERLKLKEQRRKEAEEGSQNVFQLYGESPSTEQQTIKPRNNNANHQPAHRQKSEHFPGGEMMGVDALAQGELTFAERHHTRDSVHDAAHHSAAAKTKSSMKQSSHQPMHLTSLKRSDTAATNNTSGSHNNKSKQHEAESESIFSLFKTLSAMPWQLTTTWMMNLAWWYAALHVTLWWTSFVTSDILPSTGHKMQESSSNGYNVRKATVGLLVNAITALITSTVLSSINRKIGPTRVYYGAAMIFGVTCCAIHYMPRTYTYSLGVMFILGLCMPAFLSNPYVLIEYYADGGDDDDEESDDESDSGDEKDKPEVNGSTEVNGRPRSKSTAELQAEATSEMLEDNRGVVTALFNVTMVLSQIVVGSSSGAIIDALGDISYIYLISGGVLISATTLLGLYTVIRTRREAREADELEREQLLAEEKANQLEDERERKAARKAAAKQAALAAITKYGTTKLQLPPHLRRRQTKPQAPTTPMLKTRPFAVGRAALRRVAAPVNPRNVVQSRRNATVRRVRSPPPVSRGLHKFMMNEHDQYVRTPQPFGEQMQRAQSIDDSYQNMPNLAV